MAHFILGIGWLTYGLIHSLMASLSFKRFIKKQFGKYAAYYRIFYNLFATITFILILFYQFRIEKIRLWPPSLLFTILGGSMAGVGLGIILAALRQYNLSEFSGLDGLRPSRKNSILKTTGLLAWVRHPLYTGTILLLWGLGLLDSSLGSVIMALCLSIYIRVGIHFEEKKLLQEFGNEYLRYRKHTPMLFPDLTKKRGV